MLSVISQTKKEKYDIENYYIYQLLDVLKFGDCQIIGILKNGEEVILGTYSENKAKQVFQEMIKTEEEQNSSGEYEKIKCFIENSLKGSQVLNGVSIIEIPQMVKRYKVYQMPSRRRNKKC